MANTVVGLALLISAAFLVASYFKHWRPRWQTDDGRWHLFCAQGKVYVAYMSKPLVHVSLINPYEQSLKGWGVEFNRIEGYANYRQLDLEVSMMWILTPEVILLCLVWLTSRRRTAESRCGSCDYDLTANESGVCPECGMSVRTPNSRMQKT